MKEKNAKKDQHEYCGFSPSSCYLSYKTANKSQQYILRLADCRKRLFEGFCVGGTIIPVVMLFMLAGSVHATESTNNNCFNISVPSSNAAVAINSLASQTGTKLLFPYDIANSRQTHSVTGCYTAQEALEQLLDGSGLKSGVSDKGVIVISSVDFETFGHNQKENGEDSMNFKKNIFATIAALFFSSGGASQHALGQEEGQVPDSREGRASVIEEVIVTAQKREQSAQSTAVALTAKTGDSLRAAGIHYAEDLNGISPSLYISTNNGQLQATMRGVGNELSGIGVGEAGVATHINGVYQGSNVTSLAGFFDVERLEILRGPQGTLWGRNSTGGAINVIQGRPTEDFEASISLDYGNYDTWSAEGVVSGSLSESVQARLAVKHRESDGFLKNLIPGVPDLGDDDTQLVRGSIQFYLGDRGKWLLAAGAANWDIYGRAIKQEGTAFPPGQLSSLGLQGDLSFAEMAYGPSAPREEFETFSTLSNGVEDVEIRYFTSELLVDFESASLTLLTDFRSNKALTINDTDYVSSSVESVNYATESEVDEFSQEIRLSSLGGGDLDWVIGGYYYKQKLEHDFSVISGPFPGVPDVLFFGAFGPVFPKFTVNLGGDLEVESLGIFGQSTYRINDVWAATLGLRYSRDEKKSVEFSNFLFGGLDGIPLRLSSGAFEDEWSDWSGKVGVEYTAMDDVFLFANLSKGFKAGGINLGALSGPFDEEELINFEMGVKSTLADGTLRANLTAYYSDFSGYQLQTIEGINSIIINGDVDIAGLEVELDWLPAETWRLDLVATFTDSEITGYSQDNVINPATGALVETGEPTPRTPDFSYRIGVEKRFSMSDRTDLSAKLSYTWQDDVNLDAYGTYGADQDAYGLVDLLFRVASKDGVWSADLYGKNLTDEFYKTSAILYSAILGSPVAAQIGAPRTYGVRFQRSF